MPLAASPVGPEANLVRLLQDRLYVADGSRIDLHAPGKTMAAVAREVFERDLARERHQSAAFAALCQPTAMAS